MIRLIALIVLFGLVEQSVSAQETDRKDKMMLALQEQGSEISTIDNLLLERVIELNIVNQTVEDALASIAEEMDLKLIYTKELLPKEMRVNIVNKRMTLYDALWRVLGGTGLQFAISSNRQLVVVKKQDSNQHPVLEAVIQNITGTVFDSESGEALPGVNVIAQTSGGAEGSPIGTTTNLDGQYEIEVPDDVTTLIFTYVGYQRLEVAIEGRSEIDVELTQDNQLLDEIVIVGYGEQEELTVTGSVSTVDQEEITSTPVGDVGSRLEGRVAGVRVTNNHSPGGNSTIRVRGIGSLGDNDPLFVVDGIPVSDIDGLNPNDIESMSVLKDAASSAIYGSRAANGVVVITTNRGEHNTPLNVSFKSRVGIQQATNQLNLLNAEELGQKKWQELRNDGLEPGDPGWGDLQYGNGSEPVMPDYTFPARASEGDPGTDPSLYNFGDPYYGITRANKQGTNWLDEIFDPNVVQEYTLGVSGGTETATYNITGSFLRNKGIMIHTGYKRYNIRANLDFDVTDWVQIGASIGTTYGEIEGDTGSGSINNALRISPLLPVYDIRGNFAGTKSPGTSNQNNPVAEQYRDRDDLERQMRLLATTYAQFNIMEELSLRTMLGVDLDNDREYDYGRANPEFTQTNFGNSYGEVNGSRFQYNWSNTLTYQNTFKNAHSVTVLVGTEVVSHYSDYFSAQRNTYAFEDVDYMVLSSGEANLNNSGSFDEWGLFSYFSRLNYDYQEKYLFEAVFRRDASSRFIGDYRWGTFPAFSVGWRVLEDLGNISFIDDLKVRAGWGQNGNDNVGNYNPYSTYVGDINSSYYPIDGSNNSATPGFRQATVGNPEARWETNTTTNLGIDIQMFENSLEANIDIYNRTTTDMLYPDVVPATMGAADRPDINIGEMQNRGIDVMLTYRGNTGTDLFYSITGNFTHYKNEVIALNDDPNEFQYGFTGRGDPATITRAGLPISSFYGYVVDGIFNTQQEVDAHPSFNPSEAGVDGYSAPGMFKFKDVNGDGVITSEDRTIIGNPHPDFEYGLNFDIEYKTWDLSLFFKGSYGNDIYNHAMRGVMFNRYDGNFLKKRLYESWSPERYAAGEKITVPITTNNDAVLQLPSTFYVEDGSYFKLKNLQLGYTLPSQLLSGSGLQNLRVFVQGTNLFTITNYSGLDPELSTGNDLSLGVDTSVYPTARILSLGVNFNL